MLVNMLLGFLSFFIIFCGYLLIRNERIYTERCRVLNEVSRLSKQDIALDIEWEWRYDLYNSISYSQMFFSFKPVKSFYKDHECLQEEQF